MAWSIDHALSARTVDRVIVSTDSAEIARVATTYGAEVPFLRPAEFATDQAPTELALIHALEELAHTGYRPERVVLLQPTHPIRRAGAVDRAVSQLINAQADSLLSVREIHPFLWTNPEAPKASYDVANRPMRQDIPDAERLYEETGNIYVTRSDHLLRTRCRLGGRVSLFIMDTQEACDIDTHADLALAEALLVRMKTE